MNIIIACDSFKGSLTSNEVATIIARALKNHHTTIIPLSDGGEGYLQSISNGTLVECSTLDPLMRPIKAHYKQHDNKAFIEMATSSGLTLLSDTERNPAITSTHGLGNIISAAIDNGHRDIYIGLGGSATNDGGTGMLSALGYRFYDKDNNQIECCGNNLQHIAHIDTSQRLSTLDQCQFTIACDVTNPLHGPNGAAHTFAPQKGADHAMVQMLDKGLAHYASIINRTFNIDINSIPHSGAAGGTAAALIAFLNAKVISGIDFILEMANFTSLATNADLIITGEGCIDSQTLMGKAPMGILRAAQQFNIPVIAIAGTVKNKELLINAGFTNVIQTTPPNQPLNIAIQPHTATLNIETAICKHIKL